MSFEDEISQIPSDIGNLVKGDVSVGSLKVPKIAIAVGAVGLVAFIALRGRNKGSSAEPYPLTGNTDSSGNNPLNSSIIPSATNFGYDQQAEENANDVFNQVIPTSVNENAVPKPIGSGGMANFKNTDLSIGGLITPPKNDTYEDVYSYEYEPIGNYAIPYMGSASDYSMPSYPADSYNPIVNQPVQPVIPKITNGLNKGVVAKPVTGDFNRPKTGSTPIQTVISKPTQPPKTVNTPVQKPVVTNPPKVTPRPITVSQPPKVVKPVVVSNPPKVAPRPTAPAAPPKVTPKPVTAPPKVTSKPNIRSVTR